MDHAPLRPLPGRPSGPVSDAEAVRAVALAVPALDEPERMALALVALAGRPRYEVGARLGLDAEALAATLARARKALRRTLSPLPGSGWCERAERLISDRLDDALPDDAAPRLAVHLRNCSRCVEHERRLVQASDALVADLRPEAAPSPPAPPLEVLEAARETPPESGDAEAASAPEPAAGAPARSGRQLAATVSWHVLLALAILLALGSLALAVAGALGAQL